MSKADKIYAQTCRDILENGTWDTDLEVRPRWDDGTPAHTIKRFGVVNRYDLKDEFPIVSLRRTFWKSALDELLWIWQKKSNNIRDLHSHVWDQWADATGSIGKAYGYQVGKPVRWKDITEDGLRKTFADKRYKFYNMANTDDLRANEKRPGRVLCREMSDGSTEVIAYKILGDENAWYMDQINKVIYDLKVNPASRRIITTTYNLDDLSEMGLYPCAYSMTFNVTGNTLNAILNQRSQDMLAAGAWNVTQYALLLAMLAHICGYEAGELVHVIADCHIYDRHIPMMEALLQNEEHPAPKLWIDPEVKDFYDFTKNSFKLEDYEYSAFDAKIPVAV